MGKILLPFDLFTAINEGDRKSPVPQSEYSMHIAPFPRLPMSLSYILFPADNRSGDRDGVDMFTLGRLVSRLARSRFGNDIDRNMPFSQTDSCLICAFIGSSGDSAGDDVCFGLGGAPILQQAASRRIEGELEGELPRGFAVPSSTP